MINDNALGDRLNAVKQGKPLPKTTSQYQNALSPNQNQINKSIKDSIKIYAISNLLVLVDIILSSFLYGLAIKTIFNLDCKILAMFAIGYLADQIINLLLKLIRK